MRIRWKKMEDNCDMKTALLLIAHGSRQPEANDDLHTLADEMRYTGEYPLIEPAFLELAEPSIDTAARRCVAQGAERVILLPYFLAAGVHVNRDLQDARDRLSVEFPHVEFVLAQPLGPHPLLREIVLQRARAAESA
jgi:sirohydrochlorin ferrochelatase